MSNTTTGENSPQWIGDRKRTVTRDVIVTILEQKMKNSDLVYFISKLWIFLTKEKFYNDSGFQYFGKFQSQCVSITVWIHHCVCSICGITLMTIFPMFLLASMCLWASAMSSRLNVRSITGLRVAGWSEKYGNTLPVKAFTRSALYCERKMQSTYQVQLQTYILQEMSEK